MQCCFLDCQIMKNSFFYLGIQVKVKCKDASVQAIRRSLTPVTSTPKRPRLEDSFEISEVESELDSSYVPLQSIEPNETTV